MSDQSGLPPMMPLGAPPPSPYAPGWSWSQTWIKALTQPNVATFEQIANDAPPDSYSKALTWIFAATLVSGLINVVVGLVFSSAARFSNVRGIDPATLQGTSTVVSLICVPVIGLISVIITAIIVGITHLVARALGGTGTYNKLIYTTAAYSAPLTIVSSLIGVIPVVGACVNLILGIYGLVLNVTSVKAVHQFDWGKAILSSVVIWIGLLVLVAVILIVVLALLGPSIGNIFSNIVQGL